jgi:hypothetical protein
LAVPIIITEPAVGYGGGVALAWFSQSIRDAAANVGASGRVTPPNIYGLALFGTENGTKGAAVGARMDVRRDRWRYRGVLAGLPSISTSTASAVTWRPASARSATT